jgi:hypothetical protein
VEGIDKKYEGKISMALFACEECGKQISDKAHHCVHCGAPITLDEPTRQDISSRFQSLSPEVSGVNAHSSTLSDVERQGIITKIKTSHKNSRSVAEILIQMPNGTIISTGEKDTKEVKPYFWAVGDHVSCTMIGGNAMDLIKVKSNSTQPPVLYAEKQHELAMPTGVWWFEKLMAASIVLGLLFVKVPTAVAGFGAGIGLITILFVFWASRGRSNFAKWLNGISVALGTIMVIPILQSASLYGNPLFGNPLTGSEGGLMLVQTLMQITAIALLFGNDSKEWFAKQGQ